MKQQRSCIGNGYRLIWQYMWIFSRTERELRDGKASRREVEVKRILFVKVGHVHEWVTRRDTNAAGRVTRGRRRGRR